MPYTMYMSKQVMCIIIRVGEWTIPKMSFNDSESLRTSIQNKCVASHCIPESPEWTSKYKAYYKDKE